VFKTITKLTVLLLASYVMIELTYRFYAAGPLAFNLVKFNSLNMLLQTGMVRESENPEIYFELKPDLDSWFQGVRFRTNSAGLADDEYTMDKPADVTRVAVIGSSWSMPTGVTYEDAYHSVLERELTDAGDGHRYEFINFAVEYYGLREQVATARDRAMEYDPDLIIFAITTFTANLRWEDPDANKPLPGQTYPVFSSYSLRELDRTLKTRLIKRGFDGRPIVDYQTEDEMHSQLKRAVNELGEMSAAHDVPVVVTWLSNSMPSLETVELMERICADNNVLFVKAYKVLSPTAGRSWKYKTGRFDKHPNAEAHSLIAGHLRQTLQENNLLVGK